MKNRVSTFLMLALLSTLHPRSSNVFAQGDLTPNGAPAAIMKTLDQIEPRTPISSLPFTITNAGSYYLTTNLTGVPAQSGITINVSGVSLDLMGFELVGVSGAPRGVNVTGTRTNIAIRNGTVRNWTGEGVNAATAANGQYEGLRLSANGNAGLIGGRNTIVINCTAVGNTTTGITIGEGGIIKDCVARGNGGSGIGAGDDSTVTGCLAVTNSVHGFNLGAGNVVRGCTAASNLQNGFAVGSASTVGDCTAYINLQIGISVGDGCTVNGCTARSNGTDGIFTGNDCTVTSCTARRNDAHGINATTGTTVSDCTAGFNGSHGIQISSDCAVRDNNCRQNGRLVAFGTGIITGSAGSRIEGNNVTANDYGIVCNGSGNFVTRNTASGNTTANYEMFSNNKVGPIVAAPNSGFISGSTGGSGVGSTDPWANFSF